jgi:hypothetical protein
MPTETETQADGETGSNRRRYALYGAAGIGLLAVAGAGYFFYREKSIEKPKHKVIERDGQFEVRDYPELLVAEAKASGGRAQALDKGFGQLADYIFAKSRDGAKVAMTAPVLSADAGGGEWATRFVMPSKFTRETLPETGPGVQIVALPARKVAVIGFGGAAEEEELLAREQELRDWVGAKKFTATGEPERAFYNSPFIPGPLRRTEILIPIA